MAEGFVWLDGNGPWLLVPVEFQALWRGVENWQENKPDDPSEYARACRQAGYVDVIRCGHCAAAVLGGNAGSMAWAPLGAEAGVLIQWTAADDEDDIRAMIRDSALLAELEAGCSERPEMRTGSSGLLKLFHAAAPGDEAQEMLHIILRPGTYRFWSGYVERAQTWLTLRGLSRISSDLHSSF
jgi:hypothetical protein